MDFFSSYVPAIIVGGLLGLVILWRLIRSHKMEGKLLAPPQPSGALPILGHLHLLGSQKQTLARTLAAMSDIYGPLFTIRLGMFRTLVVSNHEAAKECLATHDRIFATRPKSYIGKYLSYDHAGFGFAPYGPYWREMRKLAMVELLSSHRLATLKHVHISEVDAFINNLFCLCKKNQNQKISIGHRLGVLTLNMMLRVIAGKRYFSDDGSEVDEEAEHFMKLSKEFSYLIGVNTLSEVVPFLKWTNVWSWQVKSMKRLSKEFDSLVETWVDEHKRKRLKTGGSSANNNEDFIDVMLSTIEDDTMFGHKRDDIIKATSTTLLAAGSDTTSVAMTWVLANLLNNRHALERAQQELDHKVGRDKWVEESEIEKLIYLHAVIKETFRLYPSAPLLVPHEAMEDCNVSGYKISKGTRLLVNVWKLQRDPRIWSDPDEFRPERFLTTHENVDLLGQNFELIPFGSGRRSCPGINWALQVMRLTIARLIQGFDFTTPFDAPVDMSEGLGATLPKATPLEVVLTPRLRDHLYSTLN